MMTKLYLTQIIDMQHRDGLQQPLLPQNVW